MDTKVNYTLVGLFVVLLGALLVVGGLWLSKGDYRGAYDRYYAYMQESVSGLSVNAPVKYRGVEVGRVKEVLLNPENPEEVRLTMDIRRGTPIKEDTVAILDTQGLTGLAIVNLTGGSKESPPLQAKEGEEYPVIQTGPSLLYRIDTALSRLLADQAVTRLLSDADGAFQDARAVMDQDNRAAIRQALADLATVARTLAARSGQVDQSLAGAAQASENLARLTRQLNEQVPIILARVDKSAAAIQAMTEELTRTGKTVGGVVASTKPDLERFTGQTLAEVDALVAELRELTGTLQRVARQLEREPDSLVFGRRGGPRGPGE
jgi:phospholipid/cholesterol/gamma-HCH transport system substrate-binding protein